MQRTRSTARILALLILSGALLAPIASGQDTPEQTGLTPLGEPITHPEDPAFAFAVPVKKRKFAKIVERWRVVDLEARKKTQLENVERAIAGESGKDTPDEQRVTALESQKAQIERFFLHAKLSLEVDGNPKEWIRIDVNRLDERNVNVSKANPRNVLETKWSKVKIQQDKVITSKGQKKKQQQAHSLMLFGTPENSEDHSWWRIETRLLPGKDGTLYQLSYIHCMPASRFDKKSAAESELLLRCLIIP
jgi:hypothetical protein